MNMAHAEKCPICNGSGTVDKEYKKYLPCKPKPCHGCNGKGWIEVSDIYPAFPSPVIPAPIPNPWPWHSDPRITWWISYY